MGERGDVGDARDPVVAIMFNGDAAQANLDGAMRQGLQVEIAFGILST